MRKIVLLLCLCALFIYGASAFFVKAADGSFSDGDVIVSGEGFSITQKEMDDVYIRYSTSLALEGRRIPERQVAKVEKEMLEQMVLRKIILQRVTAEDKAECEKRFEKEIEQMGKRAGSENSLRRQILAQGWKSYNEYVANMQEVLLCNVYLERTVKVDVSREDTETYYKENAQLFTVAEDMFMGGVIFFSQKDLMENRVLTGEEWNAKKKLATICLERVKKGEDFGELMKTYSDDMISRGKGPTLVVVRGQLGEGFDNAVFALKEGSVSDLVETPEGLYIAKVVKKTEKGPIPFSEVEDKLKKELEAKARLQKTTDEVAPQLKKEYKVVYQK